MADRDVSTKKTLLLVQFSVMLAIEAVICFTPLGSVPLAPPLIVATLGMIPVVITAILLGTGAGALMGFFAGLFSFIVWTFMPPSPIMAFVFTPFYSIGSVSGNFWSIVICFVPRVLVGVVTGVLYRLFRRVIRPGEVGNFATYGLGAFVCALLSAVFVFIIGYVVVKIALGQSMAPIFVWIFLVALLIVLTVAFYHIFRRKLREDTAGDFAIYGVSAIAGSMVNTIFVLGGIYLFFGQTYAAEMGIGYETLLGILGISVVTNGIPEAALSAVAAYFVARAVLRRPARG
ncbi:MAG: ECF transporter S component [Clostridiales Family XIII bacterium]|jgi:uncharacterized membrane protein|nr:ECF transporter S component [Clostridiales Family XIII bacterium]